jgi:RHS repeat-associated protein
MIRRRLRLVIGRNVTGTNVFTVQLNYASSTYQLMAQAVNDSTGISSTAWYPISNTWHFVEIDWLASTSTTAKNGYITLWIDGAQKESKTGIDNDTRRVDEVRLGPLSGIDTGTRGTELFDAFESRQSTYIGPVVLAGFTATPITGTAPLTVTFTNTSQPTTTLTAYLWKFGDGYTSTITNPVHSYLPGYYTATLTAWNGVYSDTITKTRLITATVKADFSANPVSGTAPLTVTFSNISQPAVGITSYLWKFGDGYTSTITNPVHSYVPGYYTATLTATSGALSDTLTRTRLITATVKADFSAAPMSGTAPLTVTFANLSQPTNGMTSYLWKFGDGLTSTITNPVHTYAPGYYTVTLTASAGSWSDTITKTRFITATIKANFSANPVSGAPPLTVTFTNLSQPSSVMTSYLWNFGDGVTSTITNPVHSYALGYYTVTLTAWSGTLKDIITQTNCITAQTQVQANFSANPVTGTAPLTVTFTNSSQPSGAITAYLWKFGDGYTSTITNPIHSYLPGYYTVTLTAWNGVYSNTLTRTRLLTATMQANFSANPVSGTAPLTVTFTNSTQPGGGLSTYLWNFGDGVTSTITNPVRIYAPGYYTVTLTAWSGSVKDIITRTRLITASIKAGFTANPVAGNIPLTVTFTNTSQPIDGVSTFSWNFGDGVTSTVVQPTHVYTCEGTFGVTLTAKSGVMQDVLTRTNFITTTDNTPVLGDILIAADEGHSNPAVTYNSVRNEYLLVWQDANGGISGRRVSSSGHLLGTAIAITNVLGTNPQEPHVAYDSAHDQYLVIWQGVGLIQGRLASGSGLPGAVFTFSDAAAWSSDAAAVAYNSMARAFLVIWRSYGDDVDTLWGQAVANGALSGAAFAIVEQSANVTTLAANPLTGDWMAVWTDAYQIEARRVLSNGTPTGDVLTIATRAGFNNFYEVAAEADATGNTLVVWRAGYGSNSAIRGQHVTALGALNGSTLDIAAADGTAQGKPALAYRAASDDFLVVWQDNGPGNYDVHGMYVTAGSQLIDAEEMGMITDSNDQSSPAVVYGADAGTYLLAWQDTREPAGIYARRWLPRFANFSATPRLGVAPLSVTFTNLTTPTVGATFQWDFGDGVTSTLTNPVHTYAPGYYTVTLAAWNAVYSDTLTKTRLIAATVGADFSASPAQGQAPLAVTFSNTSHPVDGITAYQWMFGDGDTSTLTNPVHTYTAQGVYTVTLTAFASEIQETVTHTNAVTVTPAQGEASAIATDPAANEEKPVVAYNPVDREYFVVWQAYRNGQFDIYARRVSSSGMPLGPTLAINTADGDQRDPAVAYGNGEYLVAWTDGLRIVGQRVLPSGDLEGEAFVIGSSGNANDAPAVDYNPVTGEFLVVWVNNTNGENDLWAQRVSTSGQLVGDLILMPMSSHQLAPVVAHDQAGNYLVAFMCDEWPDQYAICVQRVAGSGSLVGSETKIYGAPSNSVNPDLAYNPQADEYLVVWREGAGEPTDEVYAQRVSSTGAVLGNVITLGAQIAEPYQPAVAYQSDAHGYLVVWPDHRMGNWQAYGRWVAEDGTPLESPVALEATASDQTDVTIGKQGANDDFYLAYTDNRNGNPDIYGLRYVRPIARFSATPRSGPRPLTVNFTDQTTIPNLDRWQWTFGDGTSGSTVQNPTHVYSNSGAYAVTLTAGSDTYTNTLTQTGFIVVGPTHRTVINYAYDGLYRLTQADSTGAMTTTFQYAYDPVGNRTTQTATIASTQVTNYVYDAANRLTSVNGQAYIWDDNGNLVNDGAKTYTYNQANHLANLTQGATTFQFNYNGDGVRLRQVIAGVPTTYTQDLAAPLPVVLQSKTGVNVTRYVYALGTRPLAQYTSDVPEYLLADALGSVRQIVDANGNVTLAESYEPYGSVLSSNGTASSIFAYAGEQIDTSGLIYLRARYMQPTLGIFLARDPWSGETLRPGSMNGWNYAEGNPVINLDPLGSCSQPGWRDPNGLFTQTNCNRIESGDLAFIEQWYRQLADHFEQVRGWTETAENFRHFLDGTGTQRSLNPDFVYNDIYLAMDSVEKSVGWLREWYIVKEFDNMPNCTQKTVGPDGFAQGFTPNYAQATPIGQFFFGDKKLHVASALGTFRMDVVLSGNLYRKDDWWIDADLTIQMVVLDKYDWHNNLSVQYEGNGILDKWADSLETAGMAASFYVRGEYALEYKDGARRYIIGWPGADPWGGWVKSSVIGKGFDPERDGIDYTGNPYP